MAMEIREVVAATAILLKLHQETSHLQHHNLMTISLIPNRDPCEVPDTVQYTIKLLPEAQRSLSKPSLLGSYEMWVPVCKFTLSYTLRMII